MEEVIFKNSAVFVIIGIWFIGQIAVAYLKEEIRKRYKKDGISFVPVPVCETLRKTCSTDRRTVDTEFKTEMRENFAAIKGILIVLATGGKPSMDELKELFK